MCLASLAIGFLVVQSLIFPRIAASNTTSFRDEQQGTYRIRRNFIFLNYLLRYLSRFCPPHAEALDGKLLFVT